MKVNHYEESVLKGINRARVEQKTKSLNKKVIYPLVASLTLVSLIGIQSPAFADALHEVGKVFEGFSTSLFGRPTEDYQEAATLIGESVTNQAGVITLDEVILDENLLMVALTVESDFLENFKGENENDFFELEYYLSVDGKTPDHGSMPKVRKIDEKRGAIILEYNVASMKIKDEAKIKLNISAIKRGYDIQEGKWNFKVNVLKQSGTRISPNVATTIDGTHLSVKEIVMSSLINTILIESKGEEPDLLTTDVVIKDSFGQVHRPSNSSGSYGSGGGEVRLEVAADWSQSEWIEIMPKVEEDAVYIYDDIQYSLLQTPEADINDYQYEIISREPSKSELASGYALDEVKYYVNFGENASFKPLTEWIGTKIAVNSTEKVLIQDIEMNEIQTKITFKVPNTYPYQNLSDTVLFDETLMDTSRREGQLRVAIENEKEGLYSMTLDAVEATKNYTIAIPMMPDLSDEEPLWSLRVPLK